MNKLMLLEDLLPLLPAALIPLLTNVNTLGQESVLLNFLNSIYLILLLTMDLTINPLKLLNSDAENPSLEENALIPIMLKTVFTRISKKKELNTVKEALNYILSPLKTSVLTREENLSALSILMTIKTIAT